MQFLYPGFLWALVLLAIPIIIHLFYFRRFKKVYFTNVRFLKEVKQETSNRSRLKNLLVLLSRLLAMAALVFAFAQPILSDKENIERLPKAVSIFVDNSFSMEALSSDVPIFDLAKEKARQIIKGYSEEDRFQVVTHDFEGRHQRLYNQENALQLIDDLAITPTVTPLSTAIERQKQLLATSDSEKYLYLISDFQKNITDFQLQKDSTYQFYFIPLQAVQEKNVSLDSVWFLAPVPMINQANKMVIKLRNNSDSKAEEVQLRLEHDGQTRPLGTKAILPNSIKIDTINFSILKPGWQTAEFIISDYPITFDDHYHVAFEVNENVKILSLNNRGTNRFLSAAFKGLTYFNLQNQNVSQINYADFKTNDLIILNELTNLSSGLISSVTDYAKAGGNVLVFPGKNINKDNYNQLFSSLGTNSIVSSQSDQKEAGYINTQEFIFNNVYENTRRNIKYPVSKFNYTFTNFQNRGGEDLLRYRDGSSFLAKYVVGDGHAYVCAAPLQEDQNDLVRNAEIFIPMLYKMALSKGLKDKIANTIGSDQLLETENIIDNNDIVFKITGEDEFIPAQFPQGSKILLDVKDQIQKSGIYELTLDDKKLAKYAFNYDRIESDLRYFSHQELNSEFGENASIISTEDAANLESFINEEDRGVALWKWCIILVLIFLGIESLLLRFWKT